MDGQRLSENTVVLYRQNQEHSDEESGESFWLILATPFGWQVSSMSRTSGYKGCRENTDQGDKSPPLH